MKMVPKTYRKLTSAPAQHTVNSSRWNWTTIINRTISATLQIWIIAVVGVGFVQADTRGLSGINVFVFYF